MDSRSVNKMRGVWRCAYLLRFKTLLVLILALNIVVFIVLNSFMLNDKDELGKYKRRGKRLNYFKVEITSGPPSMAAGDDCRVSRKLEKSQLKFNSAIALSSSFLQINIFTPQRAMYYK